MTEPKLAKQEVDALFRRHAAGLRRFLLGVLRNGDLADEALQETFLQVVEKGHTADGETMRGWIFKVAFHQALALRRRQQVGGRVLGKLALSPSVFADRPATEAVLGIDARVIEEETLRRAEAAVEELPADQREVLRMRISEAKTFQQIAEHLGVPLGTALTRMRLALEKLRRKLL